MATTLVLGIGNILWADEGFGVRTVEYLAENYLFPPEVKLLDGGTQGLYLLPFLEEADRLVVFDAIDYGLEPGTIKCVEGDEVPMFLTAKKMSLHQTGFQEVIATAQLMQCCPEEMFLIGVQPLELEDYGGGLSQVVADGIKPCAVIALEWLSERGINAIEGEVGDVDMADEAIKRTAYEQGRPSNSDAYRFGDIRYLDED